MRLLASRQMLFCYCTNNCLIFSITSGGCSMTFAASACSSSPCDKTISTLPFFASVASSRYGTIRRARARKLLRAGHSSPKRPRRIRFAAKIGSRNMTRASSRGNKKLKYAGQENDGTGAGNGGERVRSLAMLGHTNKFCLKSVRRRVGSIFGV